MIATYIFISICLIAMIILGIIWNDEFWGALFLIFGVVGLLFFLIVSFLATIKTVKTEIHPRIETNEYRVIISTDDKEFEFKDAYTVKNASKIDKVYLIEDFNVWGVNIDGSKVKVTFKE